MDFGVVLWIYHYNKNKVEKVLSSQLIRLQIAQKSYFKASGNKKEHPFYIQYHEFLQANNIQVAEVFVPGVFADQPRIPVVLLIPPIPVGERRPVIVHAHGGPHSRCYIDKPLADNMYLLDHGYIVAWPNYRGSIDHPKDDIDYPLYAKHEITTANLINLAAEDVYAAAVHLASLPQVDARYIMLRGGSYGARINAHLLMGIKDLKFKNMFCGVHFAAGMDYPFAESLTMDLPVLISHARNDPDASYEQAEYFMQKLCEQRLAYVADEHAILPFHVYLSDHGGHHLLPPELEIGMEHTMAYFDAYRYAEIYTNFIHQVCGRKAFNQQSLVYEYKLIMGKRWSELSSKMQGILRQIESNNEREEHRPHLSIQRKRQQISGAITTWSKVMGEMKLDLKRRQINPEPDVIDVPLALSPSEMHLKTLLGDRYREENLAHNVALAIKECETVYDYSITDDERVFLIEQYCEFILAERQLSVNHLVQYHACNATIALAYDLYQRIYQLLQINSHWQALRPDHEFFRICPDIQAFITKFNLSEPEPGEDLAKKELFDESDVPNNQPGMNDCLLATNVFLFGNCHDRKSSSIDYQLRNRTERKVELTALLHSLLAPFNIPNEVINDLVREFTAIGKTKRGSLYQVAMPKAHAKKLAYASALYGYLKPLNGSIDVTTIVADLLGMPEHTQEIKQYILALQSRSLVPPAVNLTVRCLRMPGSNQQDSHPYQQVVMQCAERIVSCMLKNFESYHTLNANMPLVRMFKWVVRDNRLPFENTQSPEQQLIRALKNKDFQTVVAVLKLSPGLVTARLVLPAAYIYKNEDDKRKSIATTALEVLAQCRDFHFSHFYEVMPAETADAYLSQVVSQTDLWHLAGLVERIPPVKLGKFIQCFNLDPKSGFSYCYEWVLKVLPLELRKACVLMHPQMIRSSCSLSSILKCFPEEDVLTIFDYYADVLCSTRDLYYLINSIPDSVCSQIFAKHIKRFTDCENLGYVLKHFMPVGDHGALVRQCSFVVKKGQDVVTLINFQLPENRLSFARKYVNFISIFDLSYILSALHPEDRFGFAVEACRVNNFSPDSNYHAVMTYVEDSQRYEFLQKVNYRLTSIAQLKSSLSWMNASASVKAKILRDHEHLLRDSVIDDALAKIIESACGLDELAWVKRLSVRSFAFQ